MAFLGLCKNPCDDDDPVGRILIGEIFASIDNGPWGGRSEDISYFESSAILEAGEGTAKRKHLRHQRGMRCGENRRFGVVS